MLKKCLFRKIKIFLSLKGLFWNILVFIFISFYRYIAIWVEIYVPTKTFMGQYSRCIYRPISLNTHTHTHTHTHALSLSLSPRSSFSLSLYTHRCICARARVCIYVQHINSLKNYFTNFLKKTFILKNLSPD